VVAIAVTTVAGWQPMLAHASWSACTPAAPVASDNPKDSTTGNEDMIDRGEAAGDRAKQHPTHLHFDSAKVVAITFRATL
jgi:hypothetical protein